jgi:hypothetical protein
LNGRRLVAVSPPPCRVADQARQTDEHQTQTRGVKEEGARVRAVELRYRARVEAVRAPMYVALATTLIATPHLGPRPMRRHPIHVRESRLRPVEERALLRRLSGTTVPLHDLIVEHLGQGRNIVANLGALGIDPYLRRRDGHFVLDVPPLIDKGKLLAPFLWELVHPDDPAKLPAGEVRRLQDHYRAQVAAVEEAARRVPEVVALEQEWRAARRVLNQVRRQRLGSLRRRTQEAASAVSAALSDEVLGF